MPVNSDSAKLFKVLSGNGIMVIGPHEPDVEVTANARYWLCGRYRVPKAVQLPAETQENPFRVASVAGFGRTQVAGVPQVSPVDEMAKGVNLPAFVA